MTFTAYIERQKNIIKNRRETYLCADYAETEECDDSEKLFRDLFNLKGLNTSERMSERR